MKRTTEVQHGVYRTRHCALCGTELEEARDCQFCATCGHRLQREPMHFEDRVRQYGVALFVGVVLALLMAGLWSASQ